MQFIEFKQQLSNFVAFDLTDIRKIQADFDLRRLSEWQDKGYIKMIRKGYYIFSDLEINEQVLFLIANKIYEPSYVSCEMALSFYGLIPEGVYSITSITTKNTIKFSTPIAEFSYRKVKPELFFGYKLLKIENQQYKIAEIEKTVLDYLYLNPQMQNDANFSEWRFNAQDFLAKADLAKFNDYLKVFSNKQLNKRVEKFLNFIKQ
ncbi:MAG: hypothetical protein A2312_01895 [Candidatus Staskawiczbacteria bacterium RIFOXYB2_FULL_32_9]|uniref:AbiEi antitoxin C-terminal domain-containing protein n=1 Tax=Candidatus Staskawiczbacteria bacterium RIFOXYD1_FULL_32_13 TaxID=1802234 RepID=A0A1G2JNC0_9BACT|nr:MAG: hypothetical protein UR22_C0001G0105 [Parcubacteria group bacterium GW2011_GWC2_32_10]OGZ77327.1 MAG: hypothetical protein A2256_03715 [Candidatus Staskawiczbacteria bacterium RIFOXYA2_FULL_32_7]OGZ77823.1 MAG: hypothetical protein A2360_04465 [Candidatus Staskawiczbacteria bacterium RIFOXYB1_FULL_32_11]OGZ82122.1 MAG: hypothetical protein A2312_01895 [Candidatus Staskawiczbacteria bacterium RIFOXYB2_FULL_32_9]OGZ87286.1 MAG: hypothetical protein A2463_02905 [Candidatus Staskawiczbacter